MTPGDKGIVEQWKSLKGKEAAPCFARVKGIKRFDPGIPEPAILIVAAAVKDRWIERKLKMAGIPVKQ